MWREVEFVCKKFFPDLLKLGFEFDSSSRKISCFTFRVSDEDLLTRVSSSRFDSCFERRGCNRRHKYALLFSVTCL